MEALSYILTACIFCMTPAAVLYLCRRISFLGKIGPVMVLYAIGVLIGNIGLFPQQLPLMQEIFSNAMVPLAIPLMLFGCSFKRVGARSQIMALITGIIAVIIAVICGYLILGKHIAEGAKVAGMLTGVYTGGTINLAALKTMLDVSDETYLMLNSYDILISFLYLTFLLSIGIRLFRKILPVDSRSFSEADKAAIQAEIDKEKENPYKGLFTRDGMIQMSKLTGITLLICAVAGGIALLLPDGVFMTVFILILTSGGIACSFIKPIKNMKYSYDIGMYFIYIFCIVVASMADLSKIDFSGGLYLAAYLLIAVFGSLILQSIMAKIFRIDADTMVIASVSFINSPPFVPMMAAAMKNKDVLVPGLSIGIIGYAVGNYLGFLISQLMGLF